MGPCGSGRTFQQYNKKNLVPSNTEKDPSAGNSRIKQSVQIQVSKSVCSTGDFGRFRSLEKHNEPIKRRSSTDTHAFDWQVIEYDFLLVFSSHFRSRWNRSLVTVPTTTTRTRQS